MVSPSGKLPERAPDWLFVSPEACGGGTPDLGSVLEVGGYVRGCGARGKSGGPRGSHEVGGAPSGVGRASHPHGCLRTPVAHLQYSVGFFWSKNNLRKFSGQLDSVWYSFSVKLKIKEKIETGTGL